MTDRNGVHRMHDQLQARLESERARLVARLSDVRASREQSTVTVIESVGSLDELGADLRVADTLDAQFRDALEAVDLALSRVGDPTFGTCIECGRPIPLERLLAIPEACKCVECQTREGRARRD